jgi:D-alanyl-D-alanine dipeptidase
VAHPAGQATGGGAVILLSDPRIAAVPVAESGDALVDLREVPELLLDARAADATGAFARVRSGVVDRLLDAQSGLPDGIRLLVIEGYRPLDQQRAIIDSYRGELRRLHPDWSDERLDVETSKFVSPLAVAPHSTGGALDLTLCTAGGAELDMGTAVDDTPEASQNACFTAARGIPRLARRNRQMLVGALASVGMVNYPTEWWHWSYGDRYWAFMTRADQARYGPLELASAMAGAGSAGLSAR